jgi:hypothetical protein
VHLLVDTLVVCDWLFRRLNRAEASFWQYEAQRTESSFMSNKHPEGRVLFFGDKVFDRLQRRVNAIHRNYDRALKELQGLGAATAIEDQSNQPSAPKIGFVPEILVGQAVPPPNSAPAVAPHLLGTRLPEVLAETLTR